MRQLEQRIEQLKRTLEDSCQSHLLDLEDRVCVLEQATAQQISSSLFNGMLAQFRKEWEANFQSLRSELLQVCTKCQDEVQKKSQHEVKCQGETDDLGQNCPINLVVKHTLQGKSPQAGQVTVEARTLETVSVVKERAYEQLQVWFRFLDLTTDIDIASCLPSLTACWLAIAGGQNTTSSCVGLLDAKLLADYHLLDGAELELCSFGDAHLSKNIHDQTQSSHKNLQSCDSSQDIKETVEAIPNALTGSWSIVVSHEGREIGVEIRSSDLVKEVKLQAYGQFQTWYRFLEISSEDFQRSLPPPEVCQLRVEGSLLREDQSIGVSLAAGAHVELVALV